MRIQDQLRALLDDKPGPFSPHWVDHARRLMAQAAHALDAADEALAQQAEPQPVACKGIPRKGCNYLTPADTVCNKCGEVHWHHQMLAHFYAAPAQQTEPQPVAWMHVQGKHTEPSLMRLDDDEIARGWTEMPLYAAAPPTTAVPLTEEWAADVLGIPHGALSVSEFSAHQRERIACVLTGARAALANKAEPEPVGHECGQCRTPQSCKAEQSCLFTLYRGQFPPATITVPPGYALVKIEPERHSPDCAAVIARAALEATK